MLAAALVEDGAMRRAEASGSVDAPEALGETGRGASAMSDCTRHWPGGGCS